MSDGARTRGRARSASRTRARRRRRGRLLIALALALAALGVIPLVTDAAEQENVPSPTVLIEQGHKLTGAGESAGGQLGSSAALSADGSTLIVGAPKDGHGAVYVFVREGEGKEAKWVQQGGKLTPPEGSGEECTSACASEECFEETSAGEGPGECSFGASVALSANGDVALVGDPSAGAGPGAVWVFTREGTTWTRTAVLKGNTSEPGEGRFGRSVALSGDGQTALIGDPSTFGQRGGAWVFTHEGSTWTQEEELMTDGEDSELAHAGRSVALSADGHTALLGGPGDDGYTGAAWAFTRASGKWRQVPGKLVGEGAAAGEHAGKTVALSGDGQTALLGAQNAEGNHGLVWAFALGEGEAGFVEQGGPIHAFTPGEVESEGHFGESLALSQNGNTALVGAPQSEHGVGSVSVLARSGTAWTRRERLAGVGAGSKSWSGGAVALSADGMTAALGAPRDAKQSGAAWVFHEEAATTAPPVVTNVAPSRGPTAGGTSVRIKGADFYSVKAVYFGGTKVTTFEETSPTEIAVVTPPAPAGRVDVTVNTANGTSARSVQDGFTFEEAGASEEHHGTEQEEEQQSKEPHSSGTGTGTATSEHEGTASAASGGVQAFIATTAGDCRVSVAKKRLAVTRYRSVALRLARTGTGPCSGSVALSYRIKAKGRRYTLRTIGTASFLLAPGASEVVTLKLTRAGQKWLRQHKGKGNASLAIARVVPAPTLAQSSSVRLSVKKTRNKAAAKH